MVGQRQRRHSQHRHRATNMIKFVVFALCVAAAAAGGGYGGGYGAQSHVSVQQYNPWGSSKYGVHQTHATYAGHSGGYGGYGGYGKFVGGHAKVYAQAQGSGGYGHGGYGGGHGGYGGGYSYGYSADVGHGGYGGYGH
ncbi:glycine-rich cell wall structural protein-like isoform X3 [Amphibalanus amphitrite]|uniref:glycine-rich cell wall structural protein-like isoform X3 n=1 Tax=Amphibalanus amphitrite TaxID=1232801 RepID=UPI001C908939|nr:glycine-rich cell wall structural protein-like isoform X3 [Amphibalanus amphitrite]